MTAAELEAAAVECGQPAYRGRQIAAWIYRRGARSVDEMTDLPAPFRAQLAERFEIGLPEVAHRDCSDDGTVKYLLRLFDGQTIESVYLPYEERVSICLSTQVGCPAGCAFCATGMGGLSRNLSAGEIVGQYLVMQRESERRITHAVYMGMGEPLWNYDAVVKSLRLLGSACGLSMRNLTVSTVGVAPGIRALAAENLPITLALSLHAPDDALRAKLIPTARKWKLDEILEACEEYARSTRRNLTFEYLLIGGVNDSAEQARALASLLRARRLPGNVNLIPFNYVETPEGFRRPGPQSIATFAAELQRAGRPTTRRVTRGHAISAACGQLRRQQAEPPPRKASERERTLALLPR